MLKLLSLFKSNGFQELSTVGQILQAVEQHFIHDKFVNGESGRNALIDAIVEELQSLKTNSQAAPSA